MLLLLFSSLLSSKSKSVKLFFDTAKFLKCFSINRVSFQCIGNKVKCKTLNDNASFSLSFLLAFFFFVFGVYTRSQTECLSKYCKIAVSAHLL